MCTNPVGFRNKEDSKEYSSEKIIARVKSRIKEVRKSGDNINLTGGEPTIHPDFLKLLRWFRKNFPRNKLVIATNGRMLCYQEFARECSKISNLTFEIALHGFDSKSHDSITQVKGSFEQTVKGIENVLRYKNSSQDLEIRIIVIKQNYRNLDRILNFIKNNFPSVSDVVLVFEEIEGIGQKNFEIVGITYNEAREYIARACKNWAKQFRDFRLYHFPLCTLSPHLWKYIWRTLGPKEVTFLPSCNRCLYKKYCLGIHRGYLRTVGSEEFKPIRKKMEIKIREDFFHPIKEVKTIDS